jgi:response regulator RpfG family c-di-GMP phosphodiesterase
MIQNIKTYKEFMKDKQDMAEIQFTPAQKKQFEHVIDLISTEVSSPIAKAIAYLQQLKLMIPNYEYTEAD